MTHLQLVLSAATVVAVTSLAVGSTLKRRSGAPTWTETAGSRAARATELSTDQARNRFGLVGVELGCQAIDAAP